MPPPILAADEEPAVTAFRYVTTTHRVFAGDDALARLGGEAERLGARRVLVLSGRTLGGDARLRARIEEALGARLAGWYAEVDKDSSYTSTSAATDLGRSLDTDLIVAIGGGSVIVAARAVAIFLGESGSPFDLMTQYPEGKPAYSPRLAAPKPPIINVPTTPTTAMNRAGTGLKNDDLDHRMEYFDPKTRPVSLIWDAALIEATPLEVYRSAATTLFTGVAMGLGEVGETPLADGDRRQAFRLALGAYPALGTPEDGANVRIDLMTAAYLQNRIGDVATGVGPRVRGHAYALATALHLLYHHIGQGEATAIMTRAVLDLYPPDASVLGPIAGELGVAAEGTAISARLGEVYVSAGLPMRLRDLKVPRADFDVIAAATQKNFNANPGARDAAQVAEMVRLLEHAW